MSIRDELKQLEEEYKKFETKYNQFKHRFAKWMVDVKEPLGGPTLQVPVVDVCLYCHGAGYFDGGDMRDDEPCNTCHGTGLAEPSREKEE